MGDPTSTPWEVLERHLINAGHLTTEGIGRRAKPRRCRRCGSPTLVGLDADRCALRADVDPQPLTAIGEALAQLEGRRTYALVNDGHRLVLNYRDAGRIAHRPAAGPGRYDVMPTHVCGSISRLPTTTSFITRNLTVLPQGAPCPF